MEITHACGYEHPSQITMDDVEFSLGDRNLVKTLADSFGYNKTKTDFESVQDCMDCEHLGGHYKQHEARARVASAKEKNQVRY